MCPLDQSIANAMEIAAQINEAVLNPENAVAALGLLDDLKAVLAEQAALMARDNVVFFNR